jgi:hypothetical protein
MLKNTLIAAATAGLLAVGSLVATTGGAAASGPGVQFGGPGWNVQIGGGFGPGWHGGPRYCKPIVKNVKFYGRWGRPYWKQVVVGQDCGPRRPHHGGHHGGHGGGHGPGHGWGNNNGPGWGN